MTRLLAFAVVAAALSLGCGGNETQSTTPNPDEYFDKTKQKDLLGGKPGGLVGGTPPVVGKDPGGDNKQPSKFD